MKWKVCVDLLLKDLERVAYRANLKNAIRYQYTNYSYKVTFWFRIGSYLKTKKGLYRILYFIVFWHYKNIQYRTGIQLPLGTRAGSGLRFFHFSNIVIDYHADIGENVTIYNGVTLGANNGPKGVGKFPIIESNVVICTGAKVIGNVRIGKNSIIGANSVVTKDIPLGSVAAGVPAKVLSYDGEKYVPYYINHK